MANAACLYEVKLMEIHGEELAKELCVVVMGHTKITNGTTR